MKIPVILLRQFPIVRPRYSITQDLIDKINEIQDEELQLYNEEKYLIEWDSVMGLVARYIKTLVCAVVYYIVVHFITCSRWKSICLNVTVPSEVARKWRCDDATHPGPLITDHLADMLLNYICRL